ncbi:MAG TPA: AmmeMemoRadiSam system protein B, partial [Spirochaetota bacterium]|nr:AmmeMemoRadiSam system protein B [Spirochaetota bacterium]
MLKQKKYAKYTQTQQHTPGFFRLTGSLFFILAVLTSLFCTGVSAADKIRPPAVAGTFYPAEPERLKKMIKKYLDQAETTTLKGKLKALVCPHAGYVYSGPVAAAAFSLLQGSSGKKIFLLGPSHRFPLSNPSIPSVKYYRTPLGDVALDAGAVTLRRQKLFHSVNQAHQQEHSLEVQLPFLQTVLKKFTIIPILSDQRHTGPTAAAIAKEFDRNSLIIVSSDLSHYHPYTEARQLDKACVKAIVNKDLQALSRQEACGLAPLMTLVQIARSRNWQAKLLDLRNSGDTAGSKDKVVGYAAIAFYKNSSAGRHTGFKLKQLEKKQLLELARKAIKDKTRNPDMDPNKLSSRLHKKRGC